MDIGQLLFEEIGRKYTPRDQSRMRTLKIRLKRLSAVFYPQDQTNRCNQIVKSWLVAGPSSCSSHEARQLPPRIEHARLHRGFADADNLGDLLDRFAVVVDE